MVAEVFACPKDPKERKSDQLITTWLALMMGEDLTKFGHKELPLPSLAELRPGWMGQESLRYSGPWSVSLSSLSPSSSARFDLNLTLQ